MAIRFARLHTALPPLMAAALSTLATMCLWAYWPTLSNIAQRWASDPQYSHGYLVPLFAGALLWLRSGQCQGVAWRPSWVGVPLLAIALGVRWAGYALYFDWLDAFSFLLCVAALFGMAGGLAALRWAWPSVAFLLFMVPLPFALETALASPLRTIATHASNYALQTLGLSAIATGHIILLNNVQLGVAEACSGLSMLVIFVALSTAVAIVIERPLLDRLVIVLSAIPVALLANITRITVTGIMHEWVGHKAADLVFHDLAGWLMMPFALAVLWMELWFLRQLLVEAAPQGPLPLTLATGVGPLAVARK